MEVIFSLAKFKSSTKQNVSTPKSLWAGESKMIHTFLKCLWKGIFVKFICKHCVLCPNLLDLCVYFQMECMLKQSSNAIITDTASLCYWTLHQHWYLPLQTKCSVFLITKSCIECNWETSLYTFHQNKQWCPNRLWF